MTQNYGVYRKQGATELTIDSGGLLNAASGKINLPPNLRRGFIPLDLLSARILSSGEAFFNFQVSATMVEPASGGGLLTAGSIPNLAMFTTAAQAAFINWASGQAQAVRFSPVPIPPDWDSATAFTIHAMAERTSDNASNNVIDMRLWNSTNATEMGTTGATLTTTPGEISVSVGSTAGAAHPGFLNISFVPGTHTNNAVRVFGAWVEYNRLTS